MPSSRPSPFTGRSAAIASLDEVDIFVDAMKRALAKGV
jgi:hypothetical protein